MKTRILTLFSAAALAALYVHAETWYYKEKNSSPKDALTNPSHWTNSVGAVATAITAADEFVTTWNLRTPDSSVTFAGGSLTLGTPDLGCQINVYSPTSSIPKLSLVRGVICAQGSAGQSFTLTGGELDIPRSGSVRWSYNAQTVVLDMPVVCPSDKSIYTDLRNIDKGDRNGTVVLTQSCPDFEGTFEMIRDRALGTQTITWPDWWTRLLITAENFTMPGTVTIEDGSLLEVASATASLGNLTLYQGSRLKLHPVPGGDGFTITDSLTMSGTAAKPVRFEVAADGAEAHSGTNVYPLLTVPLSSNLKWAGIDIVTKEFAVPGAYLTITTNAVAGTETLSLVEPPYVKLVVGDIKWKDTHPEGLDDTSAFDKAASWSDNQTPHPDADYVVTCLDGISTYIRTHPSTGNQEFLGDSLTIGKDCIFLTWCSRLIIPKLRLLDGASMWTGQGAKNPAWVDAPVEVPYGTVRIGPYNNGRIMFTGAFTGSATLLMEGVNTGTKTRRGWTKLIGDNSGFLGRMLVKQFYDINSYGLEANGQFLEFDSANALGGALPAFDAEALTIGYLGRLTPIASVTLDAASNRGLYITDSGVVNVTNAEDRLTVNWPLKVEGTIAKWGPGTLALGGPLTTNGNCRLEVEQGAVQALAQDSLNGLTLAFSENGSLLFDLAALPSGGMRNLAATPFELAAGMTELPVAVTDGSGTQTLERTVTVPLITVSAEAFPALKAMLPASAPRPYSACHAEWVFASDATTGTVSLRITPIGTKVYLR